MMNTLYCTPCGHSLLQVFTAECNTRKYGYNEAVFVLANDEQSGLPAKSLSFDALAKSIVSFSGQNAATISLFAQQLLLSGLVKEMGGKGQLKFFSGLDESNAFGEAVFSFVSELAEAMIAPGDFAGALSYLSEDGRIRDKDREIATIYLAYRHMLEQEGLLDLPGLYHAAIAALQADTAAWPVQKVYLSGFYKFNALQLELIRQLAKHCEIAVCLCYENLPAYAASKKAYEDLVGLGFEVVVADEKENKSRALQELCAGIFNFAGQQEVDGAQAVTIRQYANRRQEMQEVVADIKLKLLQGERREDFLLCMRNLSLYPGLKREFDLAGVPVAMPEAARLSVQPAAKLVGSILQIASGDVKQGLAKFVGNIYLQKVFAFPEAQVKKLLEERVVSDLSAASRLWQSAFGENDDFARLVEFLQVFPDRGTVEGFNCLLLEFLQALPVAQTMGELYKAGEITTAELKLLVTGYEKTMEKIKELGEACTQAGESERSISLLEYRQLLEKIFVEYSFALEKPDAKGICVRSIAEASGNSCKYVYIIGLKEGELPVFTKENWLYDDKERQQLYQLGILSSTGDKANEELYFFYNALCLAREQLFLSASIADGEIVSAYLDEVIRLVPGAERQTRAANQVLPECGYVVGSEQLAALLVAKGQSNEWLQGYLGADFAARAAMEVPWRQGWFAGELAHSKASAEINELLALSFDASRLESYAFCPFKFLLEYVWRPLDWQVSQENIRADAKGNIYHDCLKAFLQRYQGKALTAFDAGRLMRELQDVFNGVVQKLADKGRLELTYLSAYEFAEMKERLVFWLQAELEYQSKNKSCMYPERFEWCFDRLELETACGTAAFKGRVDRVDTDGEHYFVTDYKIKTTPKKLDILSGLDLQIPLYLLAVEKFLGQPLGGGYFSVENAKREGGFWLNSAREKVAFSGQISAEQKSLAANDWNKYREIFTAALSGLVEAIGRGDFAPLPKGECPQYCLGRGVCRMAQSRNEDSENE